MISKTVFVLALLSSSASGLLFRSSGAGNHGDMNGTIHVLLGRAVFDYQDHVDRIAAIRDTWAHAPDVQLHVLDFGKKIFEAGYKDWCQGCPASDYSTAPDEMRMPSEVRESKLYAVDGHIWAMKKALEDPQCNWILLGQDMLSINMKNLRAYLSKFDASQKLVLGNRLKGYGEAPTPGGQSIMTSPWGYFLSRGAAEALVYKWNGFHGKLRMTIANDQYLAVHGGSTDYGFGVVLQKLGAEFVDTRDEEGRDRMFLWPPSRMDKDNWWDDWYPGMRIDKPKKAISPEAFSFFFAGAKEIRTLASFYEKGRSASMLQSDKTEGTVHYKDRTWKMLERTLRSL